MDAALDVLHAQPGQVSPITINIGGADLGRGRPLEHIEANLSRILARLRDAGYRRLADLLLAASGY